MIVRIKVLLYSRGMENSKRYIGYTDRGVKMMTEEHLDATINTSIPPKAVEIIRSVVRMAYGDATKGTSDLDNDQSMEESES